VKSGGLDFYKARCSVLQGEVEGLRASLREAETYRVLANAVPPLTEKMKELEEQLELAKHDASQAVELRRQVSMLETMLGAQSQAHTTVLLDIAAQARGI
jgi:hypothetical protein